MKDLRTHLGLLLAAAIWGCSPLPSSDQVVREKSVASAVPIALPEPMAFRVGFDDPSLMEGVDVLLVQKNGEVRRIGRTDASGSLEIDKDLLREEGVAVLFCREGFFCGAFLVDEGDFFKYDERYIELAPLAWL